MCPNSQITYRCGGRPLSPPRAIRPLKQPVVSVHHEQHPGQVEAGCLLHVAVNLSCGEGLEPVYE